MTTCTSGHQMSANMLRLRVCNLAHSKTQKAGGRCSGKKCGVGYFLVVRDGPGDFRGRTVHGQESGEMLLTLSRSDGKLISQPATPTRCLLIITTISIILAIFKRISLKALSALQKHGGGRGGGRGNKKK